MSITEFSGTEHLEKCLKVCLRNYYYWTFASGNGSLGNQTKSLRATGKTG